MSDWLYMTLGLAMIYTVFHFFFIQYKAWTDRTPYQKVITVLAIILICWLIIVLGTIGSSL